MSKKQSEKANKQDVRKPKSSKKNKRLMVPEVPAGTTENEATEVIEEDDIPLAIGVTASRETLEGTPVRALTFLRAIGTSAAIHAALATRGYDREQHQQGWALLHAVSGYQYTALPAEDNGVGDAIKQIDDCGEDAFQVIAASLRHRYPEQAAFLLDGIWPSTGGAIVLGVKRLLDRLDALNSSMEREATRTEDQTVIVLLALRGISADERTRLRGLVNNAESAPEVSLSNAAAIALAEATYVNGLTALRAWFEEWAGIARVAVKRRDHLIRLGLARRPSTSNSESSAALSGQASH